MAVVHVWSGRRALALLCVWGLLSLAGCGGRTLVPVSGKITQDGKPLDGGGVSFVADTAKGNDARVACIGRIGTEGRYELKTEEMQGGTPARKGAPPGWYKVTIMPSVRGGKPIEVDRVYTEPETTPLSIEVIANPEPDRYNFDLKK
jgi:hypothetical protein